MKVIVAAITFTLLPLLIYASDRNAQVRDRYGNLVETKERDRNQTTVRDRYGDIIRTDQYEGQQTIIQDSNGNIIGTAEAD